MTYRYLLKDIKAYGSMFASHKKTIEDGWDAWGHGGTRAAQNNPQILSSCPGAQASRHHPSG